MCNSSRTIHLLFYILKWVSFDAEQGFTHLETWSCIKHCSIDNISGYRSLSILLPIF